MKQVIIAAVAAFAFLPSAHARQIPLWHSFQQPLQAWHAPPPVVFLGPAQSYRRPNVWAQNYRQWRGIWRGLGY